MTRALDVLSAIGALAMAATPMVAITATAHAAELRPQPVSATAQTMYASPRQPISFIGALAS